MKSQHIWVLSERNTVISNQGIYMHTWECSVCGKMTSSSHEPSDDYGFIMVKVGQGQWTSMTCEESVVYSINHS